MDSSVLEAYTQCFHSFFSLVDPQPIVVGHSLGSQAVIVDNWCLVRGHILDRGALESLDGMGGGCSIFW